MIALKKQEKMLLLLTIAIVSLVVWASFVLQPILDLRKKLDRDLAAKALKLQEAKKNLAARPQQSDTAEFLQRFSSGGSTQEDLARMIKDIQDAAAGSDLKVSETRPQPQVNHSGWFELKVSIAFDGSWPDVVRFLYEIENAPKPLLVNEISLEASFLQREQPTIRGRLDISRLFTLGLSK